MNKRISVMISMTLILSLLLTFSFAGIAGSSKDSTEEKIIFSDGSYLVTSISSEKSLLRSTTTKVLSKTSTYYNSSQVAQCALKVTGTFNVNTGISVYCSNVTYQSIIYDSAWSVQNVTTAANNQSASPVAATASGNFIKKILGITINNIPVSVTITCDKNGNYY